MNNVIPIQRGPNLPESLKQEDTQIINSITKEQFLEGVRRKSQAEGISEQDAYYGLLDSMRNYGIVVQGISDKPIEVYPQIQTIHFGLILNIIIFLIILAFIFEVVMRRIFYYIVLGRFYPSKI